MESTAAGDTIDSPESNDPESTLPKMSFLEHLEELRKRLLYSILAIFAGFLACWWKAEAIYAWLQHTLTQFLPKNDNKLAFTHLTAPFFLYMKVAFFAGLFLVSPFILFQFLLFISPVLYKSYGLYVHPLLLLH